MSRPATFKVDNTVYWVIRTYTDAGVLVDADSTPTVAIRKNGSSVGDVATVTKRAATTGIYDCSWNPASEVEGDCFTVEETATVSAQAYENAWSVEALASERGTDGANTVAPVDVSGAIAALNDFDPAADVVAHVTLVDTTTDLTNGSGGGGGSATLANQNLILANIAAIDSDVQGLGTITTNTNTVVNTLNDFDPAVDVVAHVTLVDTTTNLTNGGSGGDDAATIYSYFTAGSNEDAFKADVSALALEATVDSVGTAVASVNSLVQLTPASTYSFFTSGSNEDAFKATGFSTSAEIAGLNDPTAQEIVDAWGNQNGSSYVTSGTFGYFLDAQVSSAGAGGSGLYQVTVRAQDASLASLQGARVNVDGTTLTLVTDSSGEVTFNLDSGVYLLEMSPPAGYGTPTGIVVTVAGADPADTVFTLASGGCGVPWIG